MSCQPQPEFSSLEGCDPTDEFLHREGPEAPGDTKKGWLCQERLFLLALEAVGDFGGLRGGEKAPLSGGPEEVDTLLSLPPPRQFLLPPSHSQCFAVSLWPGPEQPWNEREWL